MNTVNKIGVLTSGGDSPGMNAAVRAVVRMACHNDLQVIGIRYGYQGLINEDIVELYESSVSNIIQRGGTILKSARSKAFRTKEGRERAADILKKNEIDALVVVGGDGSFTGASYLNQEHGIKVVGVPELLIMT